MLAEKRIKQFVCIMFIALAVGAGSLLPDGTAYGAGKQKDNSVHLEQVHSLYWTAVLRRSISSGKTVLAKKGSRVTVTYRAGGKGKSTVRYGDGKKTVSVPDSWLSYKKARPTVVKDGDYNTATKEAFMNMRAKVRDKEKYVAWVSLDKQRVNVFASSDGRWVLYKVFKCSTGKVESPTKTGWHKVDYKRPWLSGLKWFTEVTGGGMHKWPGRFNKSQYGKRVASGGCIRLKEKDAKAIYKLLPVNSRVLVY
jgi:lipoprotein-anchoring transpeptidase ErfK/SrfK